MASVEYDFATPLPHPGDVLREDFLPDFGLSAGALAKAMGLKDRTRIERLIRAQQPVTADTALRLGRVFGTSAQLWLNMQAAHDLSVAYIAKKEEIANLKQVQPA